jgi:glycosyltransferase involved in cell wall biosynthesis
MENNKKAIIDIILCVYNDSECLSNTIESVLDQSFINFQLKIVDDGSNNETITKILHKYASLDNRVILDIRKNNKGLSICLEETVAISNAEYIGRIDVGDKWLREKLSRQISLIENNKNLILVGTQCKYIFEDGTAAGYSNFAQTSDEILKSILLRKGIFEHSSIVFRNIINYRSLFRYSQDLDLYLRSSKIGALECIDEVLTICKIKFNGITIAKKPLQRKYQSLAYSFHNNCTDSQKIKTPIIEKINRLESTSWFFTKYIWHFSVKMKIKYGATYIWVIPFIISMIFYPPLMKDYLLRITFLIIAFINKCYKK